jgi:ABC-type multidrug transport system fused ATPase/permease subunit
MKLIIYGSIILGFFFFLKNLFLGFLLYFEAKLVMNVKKINSKRLFDFYISSPYSFHLNNNPANLIRSVTADINQSTNYIKNVVLLTKETFILFLILCLLIFVDPLISSLIFVSLGFIVLIFFIFVRNKLKTRGQKNQILSGNLLQIINQSFNSIKDVIIFRKGSYLSKVFAGKYNSIEKINLQSHILSSIPKLFLEVISVFSILTLIMIFFFLDRPVQEILPLISLIAISVIRLIPAFNGITKSLSSMKYNQASLDLIVNAFNNLKKTESDKVNISKTNISFKNKIEIKNINFNYENSKKIINDISLEIFKNDKIAISGKTGSGKTTLVDIITGLLKPINGQVMVDNVSIYENLESWQKKFGYISQNINLLDDSIKNNIAFGIAEENIDIEKIEKSLKFAQIYDFVMSLDDNINTYVGNQGVRLSGGQRQRIAIARAAYNEPDIFVLDEATSALDVETEKKFIHDLEKILKDKTLIIISHRLETLKNCDRIILIENGKIKKSGSFKEVYD